MKVLIFHQFVHHNQLVGALYENLNKRGLVADTFNISSWEFESKTKKLPFYLLLLKHILFSYKLRLFVFSRFPFLFNALIKRYTIIDIHFFGTFYYLMINHLIRLEKKIKITIWGSDFYRSNKKRKDKQGVYYKKVDCIQVATEQIRNDFLEYYKTFKEKTKLAHFGIATYDVISRISNNETRIVSKELLGLPSNKLIITCGSNGIKQQQHLCILDAIENLIDTAKKDIFILVPMTYGLDEEYKDEIETRLAAIGISYQIFEENLALEDICRLRIATDIAINIQKTDAFSAAMQEHLFAKNILIVGDWLPYKKLDDYDVLYFKSSIDELSEKLNYTIDQYESLKEKTTQNIALMNEISSWDVAVTLWINNYKAIV